MEFNNRSVFMSSAGAFEFSLLVVAVILGWLFSVPLMESLHWNWSSVAWGILAAAPLLLIFQVLDYIPAAPIQKVRDVVLKMMGSFLAEASWLELFLLAALAGICEEVLFRGFLMVWIEGWGGYTAALIISSLAFGMLHAVTWTYVIFASLAGLYLGLVMDLGDERNLLTAIVCHAAYDFAAFILIARDYRNEDATELVS